MTKSKALIPLIVVVVVIIAVVLFGGKKTDKPVAEQPVTETPSEQVMAPAKPRTAKKPVAQAPVTTPSDTEEMPAEEQTEETTPAKPMTVMETFYVNDLTATPKVLEVNKGDTVKVTFVADPRNNYHNGLEFRSDAMAPIKLANGQSLMFTFTADKSFSFTPYWPGTDTKKDYTIDIIVK